MIEFKQLSINNTEDCIKVAAAINNTQYTENVYISQIIITTKEGYTYESIPSKNDKNVIYYKEDLHEKEIEYTISLNELLIKSLHNELLYVYIVADGIPDSQIPCGEDSPVIIGCIFNWHSLYQNIINLFDSFNNSCKVNDELLDAILSLRLLQYSLEVGDFVEVKKLIDKLVKTSSSSITKTCGCNGN